MDFSLTEEQKEICELIKSLCAKKLNHDVFSDDRYGRFPLAKWKSCGETGIHGLAAPREWGGLGADIMTTALAIQTLAAYCLDEGLVFSICAHVCTCLVPILFFGTEAQKHKYAPRLVSGEYIGGNGITEADSGSDITRLQTSVEKTPDHFVINGAKIFVSNGPLADLLIIYARHPQGMKGLDISAFIIEAKNARVRVGQVFEKMGLRTCALGEILLENYEALPDRLLGRERLGLGIFNTSMLWERILMSAYFIGSMELQFRYVWEYVRNRRQFSRPLMDFQNIAGKVVEMKTRLEASKLLLYKTCWQYDRDEAGLKDASLLKLYASEAKVKNSLEAVQIFGAYGYLKESLVEKQLRDSMASTIYSGTSEIQKKIIMEGLHEYGE